MAQADIQDIQGREYQVIVVIQDIRAIQELRDTVVIRVNQATVVIQVTQVILGNLDIQGLVEYLALMVLY